MRQIAEAVIRAKTADADDIDIGVAITNKPPCDEHAARVRSKLAAAGPPPANPSIEY